MSPSSESPGASPSTSQSPPLRPRLAAVFALVTAAALSRLLPHPPNLTAVPAMAMFSGAVLGARLAAFALPLLAMLLSDLVLVSLVYGAGALPLLPVVYAAIALGVLIGARLGDRLRSSPLGLAAGAVATTASFFVVSNLGVFLTTSLYPRDAAGLVACYVAALPFAVNMLAGALLYGLGMFGLWRVAARRWPRVAMVAAR